MPNPTIHNEGNREFKLKPWQDGFIFSPKRYVALIAAWGTGKTMSGIMRGMVLSEKYPNNLGIIFRKEYTDLRDSTMKDFELYTGLRVKRDAKEVTLRNKSQILFRHADDIDTAIVQNINLGWFLIEQADELDTPDVFLKLAFGRLRRNVGEQSGFIIANANGDWWGYKMFIEKQIKHPATGEVLSDCYEANTHDNADVLPKGYVDNLEALKVQDPLMYRRFVLNDHTITGEADLLIPLDYLNWSIGLGYRPTTGGKILACDIARSAEGDRTVFTMIQRVSFNTYKQTYIRSFKGYDLMKTSGLIANMNRTEHPEMIVVDAGGLGIGVCDRLAEEGINVVHFNGAMKATRPGFKNHRAQSYYKLREFLRTKQLDLMGHEDQKTQLRKLKYKFYSSGDRLIESKEDMKKRGLPSPDYADALMMAISVADLTAEPTKEKTSGDLFWERVHSDIAKYEGKTEEGSWRKIDVSM